ncbi:receptor-like protein EIX1 [Henckelia pumila]|uniref:receptor-like protein EIX1 n=1 Tax=Henckelia pumila TaxID=405737 RepID=UPI003C6E3227
MIAGNTILTRFLALAILVSECLGRVSGQQASSNIRCSERERRALLALKHELVDEHGRLSSWGAGKNKRECCNWTGVRCDNVTNHVTRLNLRGPPGFKFYAPIAPLKGNISPSLLELKHLTYLDLSHNDFGRSRFPELITSLNKLNYLNLSNTNFSKSSIPPSVGNLSELVYLDLSWNGFHSDNLGWLSHLGSLKYLNLGGVFLQNATNWLQSISKLNSIVELRLSNSLFPNILYTSLPSINASTQLAVLDLSRNFADISYATILWFLNFSHSLTFVDLSFNSITGPLPNAFDNQMSLVHLDLSYSGLEHGIPKSFGNMSSLAHLSLLGNGLTAQLSGLMNNLSGLAEENLQYLNLRYNSLSGSIPDFSRFFKLKQLLLTRNKINGSIPKGYLSIPLLIDLDLSFNNITGTIPDLGFSPFLKTLYLNKNMFNGALTESIGGLSEADALFLGSNNLEGVVTESHLFNLSRLKVLDLSFNSLLVVNCSPHWIPPFQLRSISLSQCKIGPQFPHWLQSQTNLSFLDISFSRIADTIPQWFGNLVSKRINLNASNNQIHGIFPSISSSTSTLPKENEIGTILDLSENKITGQATFLCHNQGWVLIDLSNNLFSGRLPDCFANSTSLQFLNVANNLFFGKIPSSFGSLHVLSLLNLRNNSFSGGIPTSMRNCTNLEMVDLGENRLTGNIPTWLGDNLSLPIVLSLRFNEFHGTIPSSMCNLQRIQVLDLSSNKISGVIPKCLNSFIAMTEVSKPTRMIPVNTLLILNLMGTSYTSYYSLQYGAYFMWKGKEVTYVNRQIFIGLVDLSNNVLIGDIPSEITKLVALDQLNLSRNNLTGYIPQDIGLMKSLDSLDLSRNQISGIIPTSLSELSFLGVLDLSYNNLYGRIPPQLKFDESSYTGNSGLCGRPVLNQSCPGDDDINHQNPNFNSNSNEIFGQQPFRGCCRLGPATTGRTAAGRTFPGSCRFEPNRCSAGSCPSMTSRAPFPHNPKLSPPMTKPCTSLNPAVNQPEPLDPARP